MRRTEVTTTAALAAPVVFVLGDGADEDRIAVEREARLAAAVELHRATAQPAVDVTDSCRGRDLRLAARAAQDRRVARDRRYHHDAHATDLRSCSQALDDPSYGSYGSGPLLGEIATTKPAVPAVPEVPAPTPAPPLPPVTSHFTVGSNGPSVIKRTTPP